MCVLSLATEVRLALREMSAHDFVIISPPPLAGASLCYELISNSHAMNALH